MALFLSLLICGGCMQAVEIQELIGPYLADRGFEWVGVESSGSGRHVRLCVYIDKEGGINIDEISSVSRHLMSALRVAGYDTDHMQLEVSSPGLARPLFTLAHYQRFIGKEVRIQLHVPLNGRKQWVGVIKAVEDETIVLEVTQPEAAGQAQGTDTVTLPFGDIAKAKLVAVFK